MTPKRRTYVNSRIPIIFEGKECEIVLDPMRTVDKSRLVQRMGKLNESQAQQVIAILLEMFAE